MNNPNCHRYFAARVGSVLQMQAEPQAEHSTLSDSDLHRCWVTKIARCEDWRPVEQWPGNLGRHKANPIGISGYLNVGRGKECTDDQLG
eukprot:s2359_g8.t1